MGYPKVGVYQTMHREGTRKGYWGIDSRGRLLAMATDGSLHFGGNRM